MSKRGNVGLRKRFREDGAFEWHIDKRIKRFGRLCESTGTSDEEEAARYLARRIEEIKPQSAYAAAAEVQRAATRYLTDFAWKRSIERDARALKDMDHLRRLWLDCGHNESFRPYIDNRRCPLEGRRRLRQARSTATLRWREGS